MVNNRWSSNLKMLNTSKTQAFAFAVIPILWLGIAITLAAVSFTSLFAPSQSCPLSQLSIFLTLSGMFWLFACKFFFLIYRLLSLGPFLGKLIVIYIVRLFYQLINPPSRSGTSLFV
jgi:hypothetical protein